MTVYGFLLAAGYGTRLFPLSLMRAKPAFYFQGQPLIEHCLSYLKNAGLFKIGVNAHHQTDSIKLALKDQRVDYWQLEDRILGTGGALIQARQFLTEADSAVIMNAKIITHIDLKKALAFHQEQHADMTLIVVQNHKRELFTHVDFDDCYQLRGFVAKDKLNKIKTPYLFTGIQILSSACLFDLPTTPYFCDTIKDLVPKLLEQGRRICVYQASEEWFEFSTLQRYLDIHMQKSSNPIGFIDPSSQVSHQSNITSCVVWPNTIIPNHVSLTGCIVGDNIQDWPQQSIFKDCVIMNKPNDFDIKQITQEQQTRIKLEGKLLIYHMQNL